MANDRNRTDDQYAGPEGREMNEHPLRHGADDEIRGIAEESDDELDDEDDLDDDDDDVDEDEEESEGSL